RLDFADGVALDVLFRCGQPGEVVPLQSFLSDLRRKLGPSLRQQGLGELDRFELEQQGADLRLRWKLDQKTLAGLVERLNQPLAAPAPKPLASPPQEIIPAKPSR